MKTFENPKNPPYLPIPTETEKIGKQILDAAFRVHSVLGPGLLESAYEACLAHELQKMGPKTYGVINLHSTNIT